MTANEKGRKYMARAVEQLGSGLANDIALEINLAQAIVLVAMAVEAGGFEVVIRNHGDGHHWVVSARDIGVSYK